jgi:hypothetical protein
VLLHLKRELGNRLLQAATGKVVNRATLEDDQCSGKADCE